MPKIIHPTIKTDNHPVVMFQLKKFEQVIAMKKVLKLKLLVYAAVFLSK